jgi:HK97 family phage major capsid protein
MTINLKALYDHVLACDAARQSKGAEIAKLYDENRVEEGLAMQPDLDGLNKAYEDANKQYLSMMALTSGGEGKKFVPANPDPGETNQTKNLRASDVYRDRWFEALRNGVSPKLIKSGQFSGEHFAPLMDALSETGGTPAGAEGGFLLPVDFDGAIHERMRQFIDVADYINVENVTAYTGWRAIEKATADEPWKTLSELTEDTSESESPEFERVTYTMVDKGGFIPVPNDLLTDTPVNVMAYLGRWFGKKAVLTDNAILLALVEAISATTVSDSATLLTALKTALNKTLDPAISAAATIISNQTGFDLLDKLEDENKRPLLQPDPTNATSFRVKGRPVVMLADRLWANLDDGDNAPFFVGNGREFATLFRRQPFEMMSTTVGGKAWRSNSTEVKGIMRIDAKTIDDDAGVLLSVAIPAAS